jgi:hypothetical protein
MPPRARPRPTAWDLTVLGIRLTIVVFVAAQAEDVLRHGARGRRDLAFEWQPSHAVLVRRLPVHAARAPGPEVAHPVYWVMVRVSRTPLDRSR